MKREKRKENFFQVGLESIVYHKCYNNQITTNEQTNQTNKLWPEMLANGAQVVR